MKQPQLTAALERAQMCFDQAKDAIASDDPARANARLASSIDCMSKVRALLAPEVNADELARELEQLAEEEKAAKTP